MAGYLGDAHDFYRKSIDGINADGTRKTLNFAYTDCIFVTISNTFYDSYLV